MALEKYILISYPYIFTYLKAEIDYDQIPVTVTLHFIFYRFVCPFTFRWLTYPIEFHMAELEIRVKNFQKEFNASCLDTNLGA